MGEAPFGAGTPGCVSHRPVKFLTGSTAGLQAVRSGWGLFGTRKGRREKWLNLASSPCGPDISCLLLLPGPLYPGRGAGKQVRVGAGSRISLVVKLFFRSGERE